MKQTIKVASLNIANYDDHPNWNTRKLLISKEILATKPDVICLQEVRYNALHPSTRNSHLNSAQQILVEVQNNSGLPGASVHTSVGTQYRPISDYPFWEGLSIITAQPISQIGQRNFSWKHNSIDLNHRILQMALLKIGETELCLLHTHFTYDMMGFLDNILETIDFYLPTKHRPVILMGDMNVTPDAQEFSHLQDAGFIDLWQHFQPYTDGFSYPAVHPIQRIDYMWANEQAASLVTEVEQWAVKPDETGIHCSDHLGLIATLRI